MTRTSILKVSLCLNHDFGLYARFHRTKKFFFDRTITFRSLSDEEKTLYHKKKFKALLTNPLELRLGQK